MGGLDWQMIEELSQGDARLWLRKNSVFPYGPSMVHLQRVYLVPKVTQKVCCISSYPGGLWAYNI